MKIQIQSKILLAAISAASKVVNPKAPTMILGTLRLSVLPDNEMEIRGSDNENVVCTKVSLASCDSNAPLAFCLEAKKILELLRMIPDSVITIEVNADYKVVITYPKGKYELMAHNPEDYPALRSSDEEGTVFTVSTENFLSGLDKVAFAASTESLRPQFCGVFCQVNADSMTFVATDTHSLACYSSRRDLPGVDCTFILSSKTVSLLRSILAKEPTLRVTLASGNVRFDGEKSSVYAVLVAGKYPDYTRVIPRDNDKEFVVDRTDLLSAVKRVSICASDSGLLKFRFSPFDLIISSQNPDFATQASETMTGEWNGQDFTIGFAAEYLIALLDNLTAKEVRVTLSQNNRPALFLPANEDADGTLTTLLMPMTIQD